MASTNRRLILMTCLAALLLKPLADDPAHAFKLRIPGKKSEPTTPFVPTGAWEGFIHDDEGNDRPLLKPVEKNSDRDWMFLKFTEYKGHRIRVAVMKVENSSARDVTPDQAFSALLGRGALEVPLANIEELLTTALVNTNRFDVVERKQIQTAIAEQDFGGSDRVSAESAVKTGKLLGVDYLVLSTVTEWTPNKKGIGGSGGGGAGGFGAGLGIGKSTAEVALSIRVVDARSGLVLASPTVRSTAGSWNLSLGLGSGPGNAGGGLGSQSPISYAVQSCINKAAYQIATSLKFPQWQATIARIEGDNVFINAGNNRGLAMGTSLTCLAKGQELIDPDTGASLGSSTIAIGSLMVTTVKDSFSIATISQGCKGLKVGDLVERVEGESPTAR